ncbi:hypothetical protein [Candidatus Ferrigenium straubiae]|jgi:hypothetical protein|uniref:hypothetical protein n=1 Tax=Candidatus Ferrigenium straubiae TaxID=2919506 RepID=UPI003F4AC516
MNEENILKIVQVVKARISVIAVPYLCADSRLREEVSRRLKAEGDDDSINWINQLCDAGN